MLYLNYLISRFNLNVFVVFAKKKKKRKTKKSFRRFNFFGLLSWIFFFFFLSLLVWLFERLSFNLWKLMNSRPRRFVLGVNRCFVEILAGDAPSSHGEISRTCKMLKFNRSFNLHLWRARRSFSKLYIYTMEKGL